MVTYLTYEVSVESGLVEHEDVDAVFFRCLILVQCFNRGRLHLLGVELPNNLCLAT